MRNPFRRRTNESNRQRAVAEPSIRIEGAPSPHARQLVKSAQAAIGDRYSVESAVRALPDVARLLDAPEASRAAALLILLEERLGPKWQLATYTLLSLLVRRRLVLDVSDLLTLIERISAAAGAKDPSRAGSVLETVVPVIEHSMKALSEDDRARAGAALADLLQIIQSRTTLQVKPAAVQRLRTLVGRATLDLDAIKADDSFGQTSRSILETSDEPADVLGPFLAHLTTPAKAGKPSPKWTAEARARAAVLRDAPALVRSLLQAAIDAEDSTVVYDYTGQMPYGQRIERARFIGPENEAFLRNGVWASAALHDADAIPLIRALGQKCIFVIGGQFGQPRSLTVALACPGAIAAIGAVRSLTALQGLQRSVRHGSLLREVGKAIDALAADAGISRSELLETTVERHELHDSGCREMPVGDWTAVIELEVGGVVTVSWRDPNGRTKPSAPKSIRDENAGAAKAVALVTKAIRDTVAAERVRLDRLFLEGRSWPLNTWRERYLSHPVTGALSRGLVWRFAADEQTVDGIPGAEGTSVLDSNARLVPIPGHAEVRLWHPIQSPENEVRAWRARLMEERLRQPLKQVFRELYVVTPAEQDTRTYSNRFASHVIRQVQARALMKGRGWAPVPVAWWDDGIDHGVSRRTIDAHSIRVEFFFDPILDFPPTESDLYPYCATDQVRFFSTDTDQAIDVADVPAIVFTEAMRDVDLFVGVTTIGADPQWLDRGERRFDTYWHDWGFGELTQPAKVRQEVLASILPALRIADRCKLTDRYLEVKGDLRTYRIHLGSSNILMSPADRYLCIVAARHPADDRLFLPFDDDPMLALILSKAFLLANDTAIKDDAILRQIKAS